ncbi:transposase [Aequorivita marina]|uniref:transposase n=1 Tax=Aequorivita marina TaxID=3073654 RepID=UPI00287661BB|nr:transposase [Aequorivita sp. S2608]MDS1297898.1 transposase [Aequorivita sp. S2608]
MDEPNIVHYYNQRGTIEREFEVLKYDFGWQKLPFSTLEQYQVYLQITAICRNIYHYLINLFSKKVKGLHPKYRVKKFIFRFIAVPAKWVYRSRQWHLRVYGTILWEI